MIGRLRGLIIEKQPPQLILEVGGVGYEVWAPMSTFYCLPELNKEVNLLTHLVVREDAQLLYGFYSTKERELFRALIKVSGIGPKLALTILSGIDSEDFVRCIHQQDMTSLSKIPGIGKKTAERLIVEMRDAMQKWQNNFANNKVEASELFLLNTNQAMQDAISALIALGYKPNDARLAISRISQSEDQSREELIRLALQNMLQGKNK